jgi:hypothetical protein
MHAACRDWEPFAFETQKAAVYHTLLATSADHPWWTGVSWRVPIAPLGTEGEELDFSPRGRPRSRGYVDGGAT